MTDPNTHTPRLSPRMLDVLRDVAQGYSAFWGRSARSVEALKDRGLVSAEFDLTLPDSRGRVCDKWVKVSLTDAGRAAVAKAEGR